jgi:hypothetical protein
MNTGDIVKFGQYEWRVLDVQDGNALLITENIIENRCYHHDENADITWENCDLRGYLNNEFYHTFSDGEKSGISETAVVNRDGTDGGNDTTDRIFLLNKDEVNRYFADDNARIAYNADGESDWWWLRSSGALSGAVYSADGEDKAYFGICGVVTGDNGVRPALRLKLKGE